MRGTQRQVCFLDQRIHVIPGRILRAHAKTGYKGNIEWAHEVNSLLVDWRHQPHKPRRRVVSATDTAKEMSLVYSAAFSGCHICSPVRLLDGTVDDELEIVVGGAAAWCRARKSLVDRLMCTDGHASLSDVCELAARYSSTTETAVGASRIAGHIIPDNHIGVKAV